MYYNATTKKCRLCPDNTTNYELGSLSCSPCPKHQMTKLRAAPRFCEGVMVLFLELTYQFLGPAHTAPYLDENVSALRSH